MKINYLIFAIMYYLAYMAILLFLGHSNPSTLVCYLHNKININIFKVNENIYGSLSVPLPHKLIFLEI